MRRPDDGIRIENPFCDFVCKKESWAIFSRKVSYVGGVSIVLLNLCVCVCVCMLLCISFIGKSLARTGAFREGYRYLGVYKLALKSESRVC